MCMWSTVRNQLSNEEPAQTGFVVETLIEGQFAWLVKPVPLERYTFTFELSKAYVFERFGLARDHGSSAWCGMDSKGIRLNMRFVEISDEYRALHAKSGVILLTSNRN